jgi:hypothetical protein
MAEFENPAERVVSDTPPATDEWSGRSIDARPEYPVKRERLFPRKVLIGWALVALAAYFGVRIASTVFKETMKSAVMSGATTTRTKDGVVIQTPNGTRIRIGRERGPRGPSIIVTPGSPAKPITPHPPLTEAEAAARATTAPAAPSAIPPEPRRR